MKKKEYYLKLNYPIVIEVYTEYNGKKYFGAKIPLLPGCGAEGATIKEVLKRLEEAKEAWIEVCLLYTSPSPRDAHESRMPSSA